MTDIDKLEKVLDKVMPMFDEIRKVFPGSTIVRVNLKSNEVLNGRGAETTDDALSNGEKPTQKGGN